jgi:uncharacterized membrane protein YgcG
MIAYAPHILEHLKIQRSAKYFFAKGWLTAAQMKAVQEQFPVKHFLPNVFVRIGLFIFMTVMVMAALGFFISFNLLLFYNDNFGNGYWIFTNALFAGLCFFFLEKFIRWRNWYGNGMDDALLYNGFIFLTACLGFAFSDIQNEEWFTFTICLVLWPLVSFASFRYLDRLMAIAAAVLPFVLIIILSMKLLPAAHLFLPFVMMLLSVAMIVLNKRLSNNKKLMHYAGCLNWQRLMYYLFFYTSGNYFVIREGGNELMGISEGDSMPLSWLFLAFTAIVPLYYVYKALKTKDRYLLWVGLIILTVSVITFKHYFSLGHPEFTLTLAGMIMIAAAYFSIRYLKEDKFGLSFKEEPDEDAFLKSQAEALLVAQTFGRAGDKQGESGVNFGEGDFGGAGSGGKY